MSHRLKLILFVLAFNVVGFAEGYLLRDFGLVWLVTILIVTAPARIGRRAHGGQLSEQNRTATVQR